jgi:hypothetical protein
LYDAGKDARLWHTWLTVNSNGLAILNKVAGSWRQFSLASGLSSSLA